MPTFTPETLTRDQKSILLYAECALVDRGGLLTGARMNEDDMANLKLFADAGILKFGRIPHALLRSASRSSDNYPSTHWVEFTDVAWELAQKLRLDRARQRGPYATEVFAAVAERATAEA